MVAIEITNLTKTYESGVRALDGLSLEVSAGSVFGFLGLNGAGKSTTIRVLAGLLRPDGGSIRLFGRDVVTPDDECRRRMGFVLDMPLYFDWLSPAAFLGFSGTMHGLDRPTIQARTEELLVFFDLLSHAQTPIAALSTGMKKKTSLAAALLHAPDMLILDEPLDGIDPLAAAAIKGTLGMVARRGTTVMITSHVLETIETLCTDIGIIHEGKLLLRCATGEVESLTRNMPAAAEPAGLEQLFVRLLSGGSPRSSLSFL
jgi:ABC-2 type transport system ATP-binding protein